MYFNHLNSVLVNVFIEFTSRVTVFHTNWILIKKSFGLLNLLERDRDVRSFVKFRRILLPRQKINTGDRGRVTIHNSISEINLKKENF
jgi:hypothetical protein